MKSVISFNNLVSNLLHPSLVRSVVLVTQPDSNFTPALHFDLIHAHFHQPLKLVNIILGDRLTFDFGGGRVQLLWRRESRHGVDFVEQLYWKPIWLE